jgi:SAM-dependent methyltransferase
MTQDFKDHFSELAARYADYRPHYPPALFDFLATLVPRTATVWDCAAGNGQASVGLADKFERVIATDASAQQIKSAAPHPRIDYRVAPADASGLPDHSVELVTVAQAIHWFNFEKFYGEVRRVLADDGILAVWAYGINVVDGDAINALVQDYYANVVGPYWPPERVLVEQGYRTIPFPFAEITAPSFRMQERWPLDALLGYFGTWSATNRYLKATGQNPLGQLESRLTPLWGDRREPRTVIWPLTVRVGKKSAAG